jgi:hypothetical protein
MKLDRTLNRDEVREVQDAFTEGKLEEDHLIEYQGTYEQWATSTSGSSNRSVHRTKAQKGKG